MITVNKQMELRTEISKVPFAWQWSGKKLKIGRKRGGRKKWRESNREGTRYKRRRDLREFKGGRYEGNRGENMCVFSKLEN